MVSKPFLIPFLILTAMSMRFGVAVGTPMPTTRRPTTRKPTTRKPTTRKPTTRKPTTRKPTTRKPTTRKPTTASTPLNGCGDVCSRVFNSTKALENAVSSGAYSDVSTWCFSINVKSFYGLFFNSSFNQDISCWDTSHIRDMSSMFEAARRFNKPLASWNVENVEDMNYMFYGATQFNQPLASWNVENVYYMESMFDNATQFNQPLASWNVGNVESMEYMFYDAKKFNQNLCRWGSQMQSASFILFSDMFFNSGCSSKDDPNLLLTPVRPLCKATCP